MQLQSFQEYSISAALTTRLIENGPILMAKHFLEVQTQYYYNIWKT